MGFKEIVNVPEATYSDDPRWLGAKPEQFIDNSLLNELQKVGFVGQGQIYGR